MFFRFASGRDHPENLWFRIWKAEVFVQASLLAEGNAIASPDRMEFRNRLLESLSQVSRETPWLHQNFDWVMDYIDSELDSIHRFAIANDLDAAVKAPRQILGPTERLDACLRASRQFRDLVTGDTAAAPGGDR